jgi:hypothetical protein
VLRLLPGEETIFELRVVNHGDPSNISVDTSPPLIKAMRLKRANHHVEMEEIIPVLARMPDNLERLDGEILVTSEKGTSRIPISLISEGEGTEDDELEKDYGGKSRIFKPENNDEEDDEEDGRAYDAEHNGEDELGEEETQDAPDAYSAGEKDVESYRSASRRRSLSGDRMASGQRQPQHYDSSISYDKSGSWNEIRSPRGQEYSPDRGVENDGPYYSRDSSDHLSQDASYQSSEDVENEGEDEDGLWGLHRAGSLIQIVPVAMLILIIVVLVLTFYTATIPEFLGALASSILIVTLIIYGAATLLKA